MQVNPYRALMEDRDDLALSLADLYDRPAWMRDALCREPAYRDVEWFPGRGQPADEAQAICARCIVRPECLAYALTLDRDTPGIWAGTSSRSRRPLRAAVHREAMRRPA